MSMRQTITVLSEGLVVQRDVLETLGVAEGVEYEIRREGSRLVLEPCRSDSMKSLCDAFGRLIHEHGEAMPQLTD